MQQLYSQLAKYFDVIAAASSVDTKREVDFLEQIFVKHKVKSVLDIACGTGRHSVALAKNGYDVTGIDYAEELLNVARSKADLPNLKFKQQDVANLKLDQQFDAAICMWSTFGELPYNHMLVGLPQTVKSHGLFVIDGSYFMAVPTGTDQRTYTTKADGMSIVTEIKENFRGITRIRDIVNHIDDETFTDHSEMDVLTERDFIDLLGLHGFKHLETYYDYSPHKTDNPKRLQIVFVKDR